MEKYIKRYFWTINLVTIMICSYLAAGSVNTFLGAWIASETEEAKQVQDNTKTPEESPVDKKARPTHNPFDGSMIQPPDLVDPDADKSGLETPIPDDPSEFTETTSCKKTSLGGTLVATMESSNPSNSFAFIESSDKKVETFEIGHNYPHGASTGAKVISVVRHKVFLRTSSGQIECFIHGEQPEKKKSGTKSAPGETIQKVDDTTYIIDQKEIAGAMENLNVLATQARIVPSFKNGESNGFRIYSIKPGSLYQKIGIKNGDIIQRINNMDINSPEKALQIYTQLRSEKHVVLDLLRRGSKISLDYTIQ